MCGFDLLCVEFVCVGLKFEFVVVISYCKCLYGFG